MNLRLSVRSATLSRERIVAVDPSNRLRWIDAMLDAGLPSPFAHELAALYDAEQRGLLHPSGDRKYTCTTPINETLRRVVEAATSQSIAT